MRKCHFIMGPKKVSSEVLDKFEDCKGLFVNSKIGDFITLQSFAHE